MKQEEPSPQAILRNLGVSIPQVYLPTQQVNLSTWAVIACDQYTSEPAYWEKVKEKVGAEPSTLHLIYPEVYLDNADKNTRIQTIHSTMQHYLDKGYLHQLHPGFILIERTLPTGTKRLGLIIAVDLEAYHYDTSNSLIRPTEETILERLPPRMQIRRGAPLELPHIMLLVNDPLHMLLRPLYKERDTYPLLYDCTLMCNAGKIRAWHLASQYSIAQLAQALLTLANNSTSDSPKNGKELSSLLFAVGDGNHSLASAKAIWEEIKKQGGGKNKSTNTFDHPSRYALVEVNNIHDSALTFHPIHRIMYNANPDNFLQSIQQAWHLLPCTTVEQAFELVHHSPLKEHRIVLLGSEKADPSVLCFTNPTANLPAITAQHCLDAFITQNKEAKLDYIHGDESLRQLVGTCQGFGLGFPTLHKEDFFSYVSQYGNMPRKTFSIGQADEKRFYIESRSIQASAQNKNILMD